MEVKGQIKSIGEEQIISDKFKKRTFSIETDDKFTQIVEFQTANDKCDLLDGLGVTQQITVHFNLRGREWTNTEGEVKVFNTLDCWKIDTEPF
jgi:hypothetical protein